MMKGIFLSIILSLFLGSPDLWANSLPSINARPANKSFLDHWERSPILKQEQNGEVATLQIMSRHSTQAHHQYVIGTISSMQIPRRLGFNHAEMIESLKTGYDIELWKYNKVGRLHVYEAHWIKGNRIVRPSGKETSQLMYNNSKVSADVCKLVATIFLIVVFEILKISIQPTTTL
jgi:hypothetical protein